MLAEEDALVELDPALGRPPRQEVLLELEVVDGVEGQHEEAHCAALAAVSRAASRSWRRVRGSATHRPISSSCPPECASRSPSSRRSASPASPWRAWSVSGTPGSPAAAPAQAGPSRRVSLRCSLRPAERRDEQRQPLTHQVLCRLPRRLLRLGGLLLRDGPAERGRGRRRRRVEQERRRRLHVVRVRLEHPARQQAGAVGVGSRAKGSWRFEGRWGCAHMDSVLRSTSGNIAASRSSFTALSAIAVESTGPCCASPRSFARSAPDGAEPARQRRASCSGGCRAAAWPSWARAPERLRKCLHRQTATPS